MSERVAVTVSRTTANDHFLTDFVIDSVSSDYFAQGFRTVAKFCEPLTSYSGSVSWESDGRTHNEWLSVQLAGPHEITSVGFVQSSGGRAGHGSGAVKTLRIEINNEDEVTEWRHAAEVELPDDRREPYYLTFTPPLPASQHLRLYIVDCYGGGWISIAGLAITGFRQSNPGRVVGYFQTLEDLIGPKPGGVTLDDLKLQSILKAISPGQRFSDQMDEYNQKSRPHFVEMRLSHLQRVSEQFQTANLTEEEQWVMWWSFFWFRGVPHTDWYIRKKFSTTYEAYVKHCSETAACIAQALDFRIAGSGLNAIIYTLYTALFKIYQISPACSHRLAQKQAVGMRNLFGSLKDDQDSVVSFGFVCCTESETGNVLTAHTSEDALHHAVPIWMPDIEWLLSQSEIPPNETLYHVFVPMTAFRRDPQTLCWEPSVSLQILKEHTAPTAEVWDAVKCGAVDVLRGWLEANAASANLETPHERHGCSLLYSASRYGHAECVGLLLMHCSDVDSQLSQKSSSAMHVSAYRGHGAVVRQLLQAGARTDLCNDYGLTPPEEAHDSVKTLFTAEPESGMPDQGSKMLSDARELQFGSRFDFLVGLQNMVGMPEHDMEWEFCGRHVTWSADGGDHCGRDCWQSALQAAHALSQHKIAILARLTLMDIVVLRAYTGPSYRPLNKFLRGLGRAMMDNDAAARACWLSAEETWAATALQLNSAMAKLLAVQEETEVVAARGVKGKLPTEFFIPDERGMFMVTEHAFMSTSTNTVVADQFAGDGTRPSIVFEIKCRKRDAFGFHCGVDLRWVSQYPTEDEILFPPFTVLNVLRKRREGMKVILTAVPTFAP